MTIIADKETKIVFAPDTGFHREAKRRVADYFNQTGTEPRDLSSMYLKTAVMLLWTVASYGLLVFAASNWWQSSLLTCSLALAMAGIAFAVQHDGNHSAYSKYPWVNRLMGFTLDLLGGSSYVWKWKHNIAHHTYTNLHGADSDIEVPFGRLLPDQPSAKLHRYQHIYLWPIYGFLVVHWQLFQDFKQIASGQIAQIRMPRPKGWQLAEFILGKAIFFGWALVIPLLFHSWWIVLLFYVATSMLLSLILVLVFQLAHSVEEAAHPTQPMQNDPMAKSWAVHQVETTVDFARGNRLLSWYVGGLNFQIEHHLFPRICHMHYPKIAPILETVCGEFGVKYAAHETLRAALSSHWRWIRRMGRSPLVAIEG